MTEVHIYTCLETFEQESDTSIEDSLVITDKISENYKSLYDVVKIDDDERDKLVSEIDECVLSSLNQFRKKYFYFSSVSQKVLGESNYYQTLINCYALVKYIEVNNITRIVLHSSDNVYVEFLKDISNSHSLTLVVDYTKEKSNFLFSMIRGSYFFSCFYYLFTFSLKKISIIINCRDKCETKYNKLFFLYFPAHYIKKDRIVSRYLEDIQDIYESRGYGFVYWTTNKTRKSDFSKFSSSNSIFAEKYFPALSYLMIAFLSFFEFFRATSSIKDNQSVKFRNIDFSAVIRHYLIKDAPTSHMKEIAYRLTLTQLLKSYTVTRVDYLMEYIGWEYVLLALRKKFHFKANGFAHVPYMPINKNYVRSRLELEQGLGADRVAVVDTKMKGVIKKNGYPVEMISHLEPNRLMAGNQGVPSNRKAKKLCIFTSISHSETIAMLRVITPIISALPYTCLLKLHPHLRLSSNELTKLKLSGFDIVESEAQTLLNENLYVVSPSSSSVAIQARIFGCRTAIYDVNGSMGNNSQVSNFNDSEALEKILLSEDVSVKDDRFAIDYDYKLWKRYV